LVCVVCGVPPVLISLGVIPGHLDPGVPAWMGVAAGSVFLLAAVLLFADAVAGGTNADGSLPATAPPHLARRDRRHHRGAQEAPGPPSLRVKQAARGQYTDCSAMSNTRTEFGGMSFPAPRAP
jgi:hypothetical protein